MGEPASFSVVKSERQLFLDDHGIERLEGASRNVHVPTKRGAVIEPQLPWEFIIQTRCAPAWDPEAQVYKIWLLDAISSPGVDGIAYAESKDGLHWTKPSLGQYELAGSRSNPLLVLDEDLDWVGNAMENALYDPDERDPSRRFKGLGRYDCREPRVSPDGIRWRRLDVPSIPSDDESNLSYDRSTRTFIATVKKRGPWGRSVYLSTSSDFENWTQPELIFHADDLDQELGRQNIASHLADPTLQRPFWDTPAVYNVDVYNMGVFRYEGIYVGMPAMYHAVGAHPKCGNTVGFHHIQLACSRDLRTWQRLGDRKPFIAPSPLGIGAYDLQQLLPPSFPVVRGEELWFYYTGLKYRGEFEYTGRGLDPKRGAVCLATLRRDGFVSLDADERPGQLLTRSFIHPGGELFANVDSSDGELRAEVLDESGGVIASSHPIRGDFARVKVEWKGSRLPDFGGRKVNLRFALRNAMFYSYWIEG